MQLSDKHVGYRLKKARRRMGLTQHQVMKALGLKSPTRLSQWEKGQRLPGVRNILKLSILYKTLPDELLFEIREQALQSIKSYHSQINPP